MWFVSSKINRPNFKVESLTMIIYCNQSIYFLCLFYFINYSVFAIFSVIIQTKENYIAEQHFLKSGLFRVIFRLSSHVYLHASHSHTQPYTNIAHTVHHSVTVDSTEGKHQSDTCDETIGAIFYCCCGFFFSLLLCENRFPWQFSGAMVVAQMNQE